VVVLFLSSVLLGCCESCKKDGPFCLVLRFLVFHTQERERSKIKLSQKVSQDFAQETMPYSALFTTAAKDSPQSNMLG
jgi:hypothetical protein